MYENDGVQIFKALDHHFGLIWAPEPILQQPFPYLHSNSTDVYKFSIVFGVLEDSESICHPSVVIKSYKAQFWAPRIIIEH